MERLWKMRWTLGLCSALEGLGFLKVMGRLCHWGLYGASIGPTTEEPFLRSLMMPGSKPLKPKSQFRAHNNFTLN